MGWKPSDETAEFPKLGDKALNLQPGRATREDYVTEAGDVPRIRLTDDRTAMQELESDDLPTSGWYTIAING